MNGGIDNIQRLFETLTAAYVGARLSAIDRFSSSYKAKDCRQPTQVHFLRAKQSYFYFKIDYEHVIWMILERFLADWLLWFLCVINRKGLYRTGSVEFCIVLWVINWEEIQFDGCALYGVDI